MLVLFTCNHNEVSFKRQLSEFAYLPTKLESPDGKNVWLKVMPYKVLTVFNQSKMIVILNIILSSLTYILLFYLYGACENVLFINIVDFKLLTCTGPDVFTVFLPLNCLTLQISVCIMFCNRIVPTEPYVGMIIKIVLLAQVHLVKISLLLPRCLPKIFTG